MQTRFTVLSCVALGVMSFAPRGHAQSSVTLYGVVDAGLAYNNNAAGSKLYSQASGSLQSDRWGLRGTEDLGGGLSALFALEDGFSISNGKIANGGALFGKRAYVGLSSHEAGTVTLGRQYDSVLDFVSRFSVSDDWATGYGSHPGDLDNLNNNSSENNAIKFLSADYRGFSFGGTYAFGNQAGQFGRNAEWSAGAGYSHGPFAVGAAYVNARDPNYSFYGNLPSSSTTSSNMTSLINAGYASAKTLQIVVAGASYQLGRLTLGGTYSNTQYQDVGSEAGIAAPGGQGTARFNNVEVNAKYQFTPAFRMGITYDWTKGSGINDATYEQAGWGVDYVLSLRTDLYAVGLYQHASGTDSTGQAARANIYAMTPSSTANQVAVLIGMRHKF